MKILILVVILFGGAYFFLDQVEPSPIVGEVVEATPVVEVEPQPEEPEKPQKKEEKVEEVVEEPEVDLSELQEKVQLALEQAQSIQDQIESIPVEEEIVEVVEEESTFTFEEIVENEIHRLTNVERSAAGVSALIRDSELGVIASKHSIDMHERDFFDHSDPDGCDLTCRIDKDGYTAWAWGENIAWRKEIPFPGAIELAEAFVEGWMNSPGHRANILDEDYTNHGIDVYRVENQAYATANFSKPR